MISFSRMTLSLILLTLSIPTLSMGSHSCVGFYSGPSRAVTIDLIAQAKDLIKTYKAQFFVPEGPARRFRFTQLKKSSDKVASLLRKVNSNPYSFVYLREGYVQEFRLWAKTGTELPGQSVELMIQRYQDYPMNRRLLLERTAFVRTEFDFLKSLLNLSESKFPISVEIPLSINNNGVLTEMRSWKTKKDVEHDLSILTENESDRFDVGFARNFTEGVFFRGREREQAQLEQILTIAYRELKKFPLALRDSKKRSELIQELEKILADPELQAPAEARYVESRRQLTSEVLYFTGKREFEQNGEEANDKLWLNDRTDLGIDSESLGPVSKLSRLAVATVPLQAIGALLISLAPTAQQIVKQNIFRDVYLQEIAYQDDAKFETASYEFLKKHPNAHYENGKWILDSQAEADIKRLRDLHAEFKEDERKENESMASLKKILIEKSK